MGDAQTARNRDMRIDCSGIVRGQGDRSGSQHCGDYIHDLQQKNRLLSLHASVIPAQFLWPVARTAPRACQPRRGLILDIRAQHLGCAAVLGFDFNVLKL